MQGSEAEKSWNRPYINSTDWNAKPYLIEFIAVFRNYHSRFIVYQESASPQRSIYRALDTSRRSQTIAGKPERAKYTWSKLCLRCFDSRRKPDRIKCT